MGLATKSGIYRIENLINGKKYIGQASNLKNRKHEHSRSLKGNYHWNSHLQNSYNKYGEENFEFKILLYCEPIPTELTRYEQFFVDSYPREELYNIRTKCVDSNLGIEFSEEHNEKVSDATKGEGNPHSKLTDADINEILNLYFNNKKTQAHIAEVYPVSRETISAICRGKLWNYQYKRFMHQKNNKKEKPDNHMYGENHYYAKLTECQVFEILNLRYISNFKLKDIAEIYKISLTNIADICKGRIWEHCYQKFAKQYPDHLNKKFYSSKLTKKQVFEILDLYFNKKESQTKIGEKYNVGKTTICAICQGRNWRACYQKFINDEKNKKGILYIKTHNEGVGFPKLLEKQVLEILNLYFNEKWLQKNIAKKYDISTGSVSLICSGKIWKGEFSKFCETNNLNISKEVNNGI